jgi:hypothetical protein
MRLTEFLGGFLAGFGGLSATTTGGTDSLGAVSSESKICSEIGIELLKRGVSFPLRIEERG